MHHYFVSYIKVKDKINIGYCSGDIQRSHRIKSCAEIWEYILQSHNSQYKEEITYICILSINYLGEFEEDN